MELKLILTAAGVLGGIGIVLGSLLAYVSEKMKVEIDPKLEATIEALPGLNCGACGYASCEEAAEAIVKEEVSLNVCLAGGEETAKTLAEVYGVSVESPVYTTKSVVHCGKGRNEVDKKFIYNGERSCFAAQLSTGGDVPCSYGCIGFGDCVAACPFNAVTLDERGLPVFDNEKCPRCGLCVKACPRNLIELIPISGRIVIACSNKDIGKETREVCDVGCIACRICERQCSGTYVVKDNLAVVNYEKSEQGLACVEKCPTKCIKVT